MKQNRIAPKYILLTTLEETPRSKQPLKKKTLPSSHQPLFEATSPSAHRQKSSLRNGRDSRKLLTQGVACVGDVKKAMESVRKELHDCVFQLEQQSRKNRILHQLIEEVSRQMKAFQERQKRVEEFETEQALKKAQKVEYDIKQILQKHNEEVARINTLKEQVASARSERVVFSNLFRKLEKELKLSQEQYRSVIVSTQLNRQRKALRDLTQPTQEHSSADQIESRGHSHSPTKIQPQSSFPNGRVFLTMPQQRGQASNSHKKPSNFTAQPEGSSKILQYLIDQIQTKTEKIAKACECSNSAEAFALFGAVEEENNQLEELIAGEESKVQKIQAEMERLRQQRKISLVYENSQLNKLQQLASIRKIRSIKSIKTSPNQKVRTDDDFQILNTIFDTLGVERDRPAQRLLNSEESIGAIWSKLEQMCSSGTLIRQSASSGTYSEQNLEVLLGKMERFDYCDRILTRKQFCTEYAREMSRNKRSARPRK